MTFLRNSFLLNAAYALVFILAIFPAVAYPDRTPADPGLSAGTSENILQIREIPPPYWLCELSDASCTYSEGERFMLELFDLFPDVVVSRSRTAPDGSMVVRGSLEGYPMASFILSAAGGRVLARIRIPEENREFRIVSCKDASRFFLAELDPSYPHVLPPAPPLIPEPGGAGGVDPDASSVFQEDQQAARSMISASETTDESPYESAETDPSLDDDVVTIRVMVVYTPAAASWGDQEGGGIENIATQAVEEVQVVLENSQTFTEIDLVHTAEVAYSESDSSSRDLRRLQRQSDDHMDEVHDWRDQYFADLVVLLADVSDVGGISYLLNDPDGSPDYAFSLVRVQQATDSYTFVHEVGHNLGLHHHKEQYHKEKNGEPGPGLFEYSAGWRWEGEDDQGDSQWYNTVMSYSSGDYFENGLTSITLPYFSYPDVYHNGYPTGHPEDGDNARTVREIRDVVAAYRDDPDESPANEETDPRDLFSGGSSGGCFIASLAP